MITLGTHVVYTHEAAVARKRLRGWHFPPKGNGIVPYESQVGENGLRVVSVHPKIESVDVNLNLVNPEEDNKTVATWESNGAGIVTGLVRKMIGKSIGSSGGGEDYDQGYFIQHGHMDLYTVRFELRGTGFVYVPVWAARAVVWAS